MMSTTSIRGVEEKKEAKVPNVNEQHVAAPGDAERHTSMEEGLLGIPAVGRFAQAVSDEVDQHLTDDVVEARLADVRRALARAGTRRARGRRFAQELARYGYTLVRMWLQVIRIEMQGIAAVGLQNVHLNEAEIHELAKDTAARAIASFLDEQEEDPAAEDQIDLKAVFLAQCVRRLPDAFRGRQLSLGKVGLELDEELGQPPVGLHLVRALWYCVTDSREETAQIMRNWTDSDQERDDIIEATRQAFDRAKRLYPEIGSDAGGSVGLTHRVRPS
jgi:hypothetical protein